MAVTKSNGISDLSFTCPTVGPRDYVTKGPSGWPETFRRKIVDARLIDFIKSLVPTIDVDELVDFFIARRELMEKPEPLNWFTIVGFLARRLGTEPKNIPHECGIAFWGLVELAVLARGAN